MNRNSQSFNGKAPRAGMPMKGLPAGWIETSIGEVIEPYSTIDPRTKPNKHFRYIDIGSIDNTKQIIAEPKEFMGRNAPSRARRLVNSGDVLFSTVRTYLKNVAIVPQSLDGALTSTGIAVLRSSSAIENAYLFNWVRSDEFVESMSKAQDGTLYPAVRDSDVNAGKIPLPPLAEQRRITAKLETLIGGTARARIELDRIPTLIEHYKQAIFASTFSSEKLSRWVIGTVQERIEEGLIGLVRSKNEQKSHGSIPYIRMNHFDLWGRWNADDLTFVNASKKEIERFELRQDDLLFNTRNSVELVGKVALWPADRPGCLYNNNILRIRFKRGVNPKFVFYYMMSPYFRRYLEGVKSATTSVAAIYQRSLYAAPLPLPSLQTQNEIVQNLSKEIEQIAKLSMETDRADKLIDSLNRSILAKAFRGELVPQHPSDEPASALLERVLAARAHAPQRPRSAKDHRPGEIELPETGAQTVIQKEYDMNKTRKDVPSTHLCEIVRNSGGKIQTEALWRASEMQIDEFYKLLRNDVAAKRLSESKDKASIINAS
jgi:type I restriction enzyme, S subunit